MFKENKAASFSLILAVLMVQLDGTIVNVSLPTIADYFSVDTGLVSWCVMVYLLAVSCTLLFFGRLCDIYGVKKIILAGYSIFVLFSILCALSTNIYMLIFSRFFQGVGGAALNIGVFVFVPKFFPPEQTGKVFGVITTSAAVGTTLGNPVGGLLTGYLSWQWIFLINIPIGLLAIYIVSTKLHEKISTITKKVKPDYVGLILYIITVISFLYILNKGGDIGWFSEQILILIAIFVIGLTAFIIFEKRVHNPLIDFSLFKNKALVFAVLSGMAGYIFLASSNFFMPFYLENIIGLNSEESGMVLLSYALPLMFVGPIAGKWSAIKGSTVFCSLAMLLAASAALLFALFLHLENIYVVIGCLFLLGVAFGSFNSPNHNFVKNLGRADAQGSLFGTEQTVYRFSMAAGITFFEMIYSFGLNSNDSANSGVSGISKSFMIPGFQDIFIAGAIFCTLALIFALLAGKAYSKTQN